jgi:hypothetical protein
MAKQVSQEKETALDVLKKQMEKLMEENRELKQRQYVPPEVYCTVNERGGVSVNGLGKYPVQLFPEQMQRMLSKKDMILKFIEDNKDDLSWKNGQKY